MTKRGQAFFFLPALGMVAVFLLLPSALTLCESFFTEKPGGPAFIGLSYYQYALTDPKFLLSLKNNLIYFLWTLLFEVGAGLALALGLENITPFNRFLRLAFFSPAVLSMVVVGLVFGFLFKEGVGLFPGLLIPSRALLVVSLVSGWAYAGFFMVIFLAALAAIPEDILEAAALDGANRWQTAWRIKLPLLRSTGAVALFICFTGAFKAFDLFWVLVPNQDYGSILSTLLVKEVFQYDHKGYGAALAVLMTLLVLAPTLLALLVRNLASIPRNSSL